MADSETSLQRSMEIHGTLQLEPAAVEARLKKIEEKLDGREGKGVLDFVVLPPDPPLSADCLPRFQADMKTFAPVIADIAALRTKLSNGQLGSQAVSTVDVPLGIHPGLAEPATANRVRNEMLSFLERHISAGRLGSMAIAGLLLLSSTRTDARRRPAICANAKSRWY